MNLQFLSNRPHCRLSSNNAISVSPSIKAAGVEVCLLVLLSLLAAGCSPRLTDDCSTDVLSKLFDRFYNFGQGLSASWMSFFLRATAILALGTAIPFFAFKNGSRSVSAQCLWLAVAVLLGSVLPVEKWVIAERVLRTWVLLLCVLLIIVLPRLLPKYVVNDLGRQKRITAGLYVGLAVMFLANCFSS